MADQIIYKKSSERSALRQGEILTDVIQYNPVASDLSQESEDLAFDPILHPVVIVVSQDCDLDWDYQARQPDIDQPSKLLNSVIFCEISLAQEIKNIVKKTEMWNLIKTHRDERYYFFEKIPDDCDLQNQGLQELTADFKKVFGLDSKTIYRQLEIGMAKRRTLLNSPYLEHFTRKFYNFHNRVALPLPYQSE
jgi:hypothetical protein